MMTDQNTKRKTNGFTLLEILMVVAGIAILAAIVTLEINPKRELAKARNQERESDVNTIRNALKQYSLDNQGQVPSGVTADLKDICQGNCTTDSSQVDVSVIIDYLALEKLPHDPDKADGDALTGYEVAVSREGNYRVKAPKAENGETIAVGPEADDLNALLLDDYPNASVAYSVRLLDVDYSGPALTIRRGNDDNTTDIGFKNKEVDTSEIESFCGTNNCYVQTWHDQSGNDIDSTQSTLSQQPQIYDGNSIITENGKPAVDFDGSDDMLEASAQINTLVFSSFVVFRSQDTGGNNRILHIGSTDRTTHQLKTSMDFQYDDAKSAGYRHPENETVTIGSADNNQHLYTYFRPSDTKQELFVDGGALAGENTNSTTTFTSEVLRMGATADGWNHSDSLIQETIVYEADQSSNRSGIEPNINDYFSIY